MAVLTRSPFLALLAALLLPGGAMAHMGPELPFLHPAGEEAALAASVVSSYLSEQMARDVVPREKSAGSDALAGVTGHEGPLALVRAADWEKGRSGELTSLGPPLAGPGGAFQLVAGREAAAQLSFSLLPQYASRLAEKMAGWDWAKALARVRAGEGRRKVALDLLRSADLL